MTKLVIVTLKDVNEDDVFIHPTEFIKTFLTDCADDPVLQGRSWNGIKADLAELDKIRAAQQKVDEDFDKKEEFEEEADKADEEIPF
jgi:hypothetical protein